MTIRYNPLTKEPYLRLPAPLSNIIITPHRLYQLEETCAALCKAHNDPRVYRWLEGPPFPYLREHGEDWVKAKCKERENVLSVLQKEFENAQSPCSANGISVQEKQQPFFDVCPFSCIREVLEEDPETGSPTKDVLIGDVDLTRYVFYELPYGSEERAEAQRRNDDLPAGDEGIYWGLGNFLSPEYHGKGIMTLAVRTVIYDFGIPRMNVRILKASAFVENKGSLKVLSKNGFDTECTLKDWAPVSESRGGGRRSIVVLKWRGIS